MRNSFFIQQKNSFILMILVTGGTGLVGCYLLFHLTENQEVTVRATYRNEHSLQHIKYVFEQLSVSGKKQFDRIEWVKADINNISELENAFQNVEFVFHCAGFVSFDPNDFDKLIKINVEGTANIVNLCLDFGVKKLCHVSSIATLSATSETVTNEESNWNSESYNSDYAISKHGGEMEVWRGSQEGLDVVIVNPSVVLGAYFWDTSSGVLFKKIAKGLAFYPTGGTGFVDVNDLAKAMISLQFSEIKNERFIINGKNETYKAIFDKIASLLNVSSPKLKISHRALRTIARIDGFLHFFRLKKRSLTIQNADSLGVITRYCGNKITQKISFSYTDLETSLKNITAKFPKN